jgi:hypothetical protein
MPAHIRRHHRLSASTAGGNQLQKHTGDVFGIAVLQTAAHRRLSEEQFGGKSDDPDRRKDDRAGAVRPGASINPVSTFSAPTIAEFPGSAPPGSGISAAIQPDVLNDKSASVCQKSLYQETRPC